MIRGLRGAHRWIWTLLALLLPAFLALALASRHPRTAAPLPPALTAGTR